MKKFLFIVFLFIIMFIPNNVYASEYYDYGYYFYDYGLPPLEFIENGKFVFWPENFDNAEFITLDDFNWAKSMFGRNGSNVKDIKFLCSDGFNSAVSDYIRFELGTRYEGEYATLRVDACQEGRYYELPTKTKQQILYSLFDRDTFNGNDNRIGLYFEVLKDFSSSNEANWSFGFSIELKSSQEIIVEMILASINRYNSLEHLPLEIDLGVIFYDAYDEEIASFALGKNFDPLSSDTIMNRLYAYKVPSRFSEVYRVDLVFNAFLYYGVAPRQFVKGDYARFYLDEFNLFSTQELLKVPYYEDTEAEYRQCRFFDVYCGLYNFSQWFIYDFPLVKVIRTFYDLVVGGLNSLSYVLNTIFLPLSILPKVNGVDFSVIVPAFVIFIILYKWFVG